MELEFDNEIDALLRKARDGGRGVLVGDTTKLHLDADEISAFAENALPDSTKQKYIAHFADCERCRSTLSDLILLNSEAGTVTASAISAPGIVEATVPWYRKLFLFPNLAYAMGGLVLLFGGFLAFSVINNTDRQASSEVSQIAKTEEPVARGPNLGYADTYSNTNASVANSTSSAANTMANVANSAANTAAPRNSAVAVEAPSMDADAKKTAPSGFAVDGITTGGAAPVPPPKPADRPVTMMDKNDLSKTEEQRRLREQEVSKEKDELKFRSQPAPSIGGPLKKGPGRNERNDTGLRNTEPAAKMSAKPESAATKSVQSESSVTYDRKRVSGKTFELKNVWYDSAYSGQSTNNIRRGTSDYQKLDTGLKAIAESLKGIVVVVWKNKAYRIQ